MYTWGYIKDVSLAKLDLDEREANELKLLGRFPYYANEVITQVSSTIKPKYAFTQFNIEDKRKAWEMLCKKYGLYDYKVIIDKPDTLTDNEIKFWDEWEQKHFVGELITMPEDFISFGSDVNVKQYTNCYNDTIMTTCTDLDFSYKGYNQLLFYDVGVYTISYNARWYMFSKSTKNSDVLDIPADVLDCIPSYIAHQCYKIDDEQKAAIFRNEYEIALSRIDDTNFRQTRQFIVDGDW